MEGKEHKYNVQQSERRGSPGGLQTISGSLREWKVKISHEPIQSFLNVRGLVTEIIQIYNSLEDL